MCTRTERQFEWNHERRRPFRALIWVRLGRHASNERVSKTTKKKNRFPPRAAELLEPVGGERASARGEGLPEGVGVAESGGVEGVVHLLRRRLSVTLEDDLRQLRLIIFVVVARCSALGGRRGGQTADITRRRGTVVKTGGGKVTGCVPRRVASTTTSGKRSCMRVRAKRARAWGSGLRHLHTVGIICVALSSSRLVFRCPKMISEKYLRTSSATIISPRRRSSPTVRSWATPPIRPAR